MVAAYKVSLTDLYQLTIIDNSCTLSYMYISVTNEYMYA